MPARAALSRLLAPRSIAVVGGGVWAANLIAGCRRIGFSGPVWPVHPGRAEVGGLPALPRLEELPEPPDAAFLAVNRAATVEAVGVLSAMGAGGAVCFASGWAEAAAEMPDGPALQAALVATAGDMPILGPNCYGFVNALDGVALWPDQHGLAPVETGVAILTQSSNIALTLSMQTRGLPIGAVIACGNQARTRQADLAAHLLADRRVTAIGLHMEAPGDLRALEALGRAARDAGKPVVVLRTGLSEAGRAAGQSHTAALAGSAAGARALHARLGFVETATPAAFLEALKLAHGLGARALRRVSAMCCSGGEAGLLADALATRAPVLPPLSEAQETALRGVLGPRVALANPLDYHTHIWGDVAAMAECFAAMLPAQVDLGLLVVDYPRADRCDPTAWAPVMAAAAAASRRAGRPLALLSTLPEGLPEAVCAEAVASGLVPLSGLGAGLDALDAWARRCAGYAAPLLLAGPERCGRAICLDEAEAKRLLARAGLVVPRGAVVGTAEAAAEAARALTPPLAVKGLGFAHKTEAGALRLGLAGPDAVAQAARDIRMAPLLVEEMVAGGVAELLVGVRRDPAHGFVLTLGGGGVLAELMADVAHLLLPVSGAEIDAALSRLRVAALLDGYRGAPPADRGEIRATVQAVARFAEAEAGRLEEVEVNPLICTPAAAIAVDALIRFREGS